MMGLSLARVVSRFKFVLLGFSLGLLFMFCISTPYNGSEFVVKEGSVHGGGYINNLYLKVNAIQQLVV